MWTVEHSGVGKIPIPGACFSHMHVDLVDPLPASRDGTNYLLIMIDRSTRWPEAVPLGRIDVDSGHGAGGVHHYLGGPLWRASPHHQVGGPLWCASPHHHQQGDPVHLWHMGRLVSEAGGTAHHHYSLPPQGQWHVGVDPPHSEGGPEGVHCFDGSPTPGLAGQAGCSQRVVWCVGRRGSPTAAAGGAWSATAAQ